MNSLKRRSLLALLTSIFIERLAIRPIQAAKATVEKPKPIVVIGAGLAGLAAASELHKQGREVMILEARDRVGGRLWTSQKWSDAPMDLGASWIHGVLGNPITKLAQECDAERVTTSYDNSIIFDSNGDPLNERRIEQLEELRTKLHRAIRDAQDDDVDKSIDEVAKNLAKRLKANQEAIQLLNFLVSSEFEQEYAGDAKRLSAYWYDSDKAFDGDDELFVEGYQVIVDWLSKDQAIRLGEAVKSIEWSEDIVRIITHRGEFIADKVLITLPLGVLKGGLVKFAPELPRAKSNAISKLEMGTLNKCFLRFPDVFWPTDVDWLEYIPSEPGHWTEWVSFANAADKPILLGFMAGNVARQIENLTDQQIVASAMATLRKIFGEDIPAPTDYQITRWFSDPFAHGSYSYNPVGSHPKLRSELAKPVDGKLYFAGEATEEDYFGTAHGAYLSGIRAAREILG